MSLKSVKNITQNLKNTLWHLPKSIFYNFIFGFPSKKLILIGVTGTDGKTTTCTLVHQILSDADIKSGLITTIGAKIGDKKVDTGLHTTSPDPSIVQKLFSQMVEAGMTHAVCEITSHALDQHRYWGCKFKVSAITNTSHEHLDYHQSMAGYIESKSKLFHQSETAVLNKDDQSYKIITKNNKIKTIEYSIKSKSDLQAKDIKLGSKFLSFYIGGKLFKTDSNYYYQVNNILAALGISKVLGINDDIFKKSVLHFPETKGRREEVPNNFKFRTLVDFAHTPAALESTLSSLKKNTTGRLIVIFGATGGRDKSKRPIMGKMVSEIADIAIVTADDTRNENVEDINNQIIKGMGSKTILFTNNEEINTAAQISKINLTVKDNFVCFNIPNRQDAFNLATKLAQTGDTIIACGKGHETTILHGNTEYPWSESEAFRTAFRFRSIK